MSQTGPGIAAPDASPDVELRLPADGAYASVVRTLTAGLAARLDFTLDDIEDLRIAVGEASAMVLPEADETADLVASFWLRPGKLTVSIGVSAASAAPPDYDSFAWQVLTTLATSASVVSVPGQFVVTMTMLASHLGAEEWAGA